MSHRISRRKLLATLAASCALPACAEAPKASLRPAVRADDHFKRAVPDAAQIIADAQLGGQVSFSVSDVATGTPLEVSNAGRGIPPASVTKAITALYALDALGAGHRFVTRLVAEGPVVNGVLQGDLVLVGGADPTLNTDDLAGLAQGLKTAGIREVQGKFKVADGMLPDIRTIDPGQPDHVGYSPAVSGIALNFNRVHFEWRRASSGYTVTMDARTDARRPAVAMARMTIADRAAPVYTYRSTARTDDWSVARGALGRAGARWLPVRKPALYAGDVFQTLARAQGIALKAPVVVADATGGSVLARHQSQPLRTILQDMLRFSTNVTAEMVGLAATTRKTGRPATLAASARTMSRWAETTFATDGISLVDHSGLGDKSRMTAQAMVAALVRAQTSNTLRPILRQISMRDARGRVLPNHPVTVEAKTGTLNFVSGLAGYMTGQNGKTLAFAIFAADEATRKRIAKADRESPRGASAWNKRAKAMQQRLIERWGTLYAA